MIERPTTKQLLAASLIELAGKKSVDKISVKEIVTNCGMTTTTFYNHFADKYVLLASIYNKEIEPAFSRLGNKISWCDVLRIFCTTLSDKQSFFLNALKNTSWQTSFRYATNDYAIDLLRERLRILGKEDDLPIEIDFLAKYYMRSISEMIQEWFIGGQKIPLDNFIELLVLAMPEPLKKRLL